VPLPPFDEAGNLPIGEHMATWKEVEESLGWNFKRRNLLVGLHYTVKSLSNLGVTKFLLDGSFTTIKERPNDIEVVFVPPLNVDMSNWGIFSFAEHSNLKKIHGIDLWPYPSPQRTSSGATITIVDFFLSDRDGNSKGIVQLDLEGFE
jgi:hypothetical protein